MNSMMINFNSVSMSSAELCFWLIIIFTPDDTYDMWAYGLVDLRFGMVSQACRRKMVVSMLYICVATQGAVSRLGDSQVNMV